MAEMIPLHQELADIESLSDLALFPSSVSSESVPVGGITVSIKDSGVVTMETTSPVSMSDSQGMDSVQQESERPTSPAVSDHLDKTKGPLPGCKSVVSLPDQVTRQSGAILVASSVEKLSLADAVPSQGQVTVSRVDATAVQSADAAVAMPTTVSTQQLPISDSVSMDTVGEYYQELPERHTVSPSICYELMQATDTYLPERQTHMKFANISKSDRTDGQLVVVPTKDGIARISPRTLSGVETPTSSQVNIVEVSVKQRKPR